MKNKVVLIIAAVSLAIGYFACCAVVDKEYITPHTSVNGIEIGGMKAEDAVSLLEREAKPEPDGTVVTVRFKGEEYPVDMGSALVWEYQPAVEKIQKPVRDIFLARGFFLIKSIFGGTEKRVFPVVKSEELFEEAIEASGLAEAGTTKQTVYQAEEDGLVFTIGTKGEEADKTKLKEELRKAVGEGTGTAIECPVSVGRVEAVDLDQVYEEVCREPENATLDPENNYQIKESVMGIRFDKEYAHKVLESAEEGSVVTIKYIKEEPKITTEDLKEHLFSDKLATYSTLVRGTQNRKDNISLATEKCNGAILLSGDVFSYNDTVGEQTAETGYKLANATLDGQVVQAYGGGICQVSSTIFAAALYANLDILERWEHEYVSSYIDAGLDAAVAWGFLDFRVCNNQEYPIRFDIYYIDDILTVDIWGTKTDNCTVEIETQTVDDSGGKLNVQTNRRVYDVDQDSMVVEQIAYSTYIN